MPSDLGSAGDSAKSVFKEAVTKCRTQMRSKFFELKVEHFEIVARQVSILSVDLFLSIGFSVRLLRYRTSSQTCAQHRELSGQTSGTFAA